MCDNKIFLLFDRIKYFRPRKLVMKNTTNKNFCTEHDSVERVVDIVLSIESDIDKCIALLFNIYSTYKYYIFHFFLPHTLYRTNCN